MKKRFIDPMFTSIFIFFVLLILLAVPLTLVIRARIEMG